MSFLPALEEGLGFTTKLFQKGAGDGGKIFNSLEIRVSMKLRYLLSFPLLPAHSKTRN